MAEVCLSTQLFPNLTMPKAPTWCFCAPSPCWCRAHQNRVIILTRGRRADPGSELCGPWTGPRPGHMAQAWGQPPSLPPGTGVWGQEMVGGLLGVEALDRGLLPKLCPARRPGRPCGMQLPPWRYPSRVPIAMSAPLSPCPVPAQAHGSRLRLYQLSPADSGEYMCRVVSSSGSLEASIMVTVEASGSSAVPVSGKSPGGGARRLKRGRGDQQAEVKWGAALGPWSRDFGAWHRWAWVPAPLSTP